MENGEQNQWTEWKTIAKRANGGKKPSRKLDDNSISMIYATTAEQDSRVKIVYHPTQTNHSLTIEEEAKHIPWPSSTQTEISARL